MDQLWLNMNTFWGAARTVDWISTSKIVLQLIIIGYAIIWTWGRIRGTQAERLVKGLMVLISICIASWMLGLTLITSILQQLIPAAVLSLLIIFQPELRRGLGYLGRTTLKVDLSLADNQKQQVSQVVTEIITAVRDLSRERIGALIVIEPAEGRDYLSPGTTLNADISANLLLCLFAQKSPLHDGAVLIRLNKIIAAGVILPVSQNPKLSYRYGTRHRAAIGLSEIYDGLCIVVSEETGSISAANRGMLVRYNSADELSDALSYFFSQGTTTARPDSPLQSFLALFGGGTRPEAGAAASSNSASGLQGRSSLPAKAATPERFSVAPQSEGSTEPSTADTCIAGLTSDDDLQGQTTPETA